MKKTDQKKNKFTLNVYADDKTYEKKDRNVNEPLQFYSGKDPALFEIVVNSISSRTRSRAISPRPRTRPLRCLLLNNGGLGREHEAGLIAE